MQRADLACLAILLAANPVVWFFDTGVLHSHSPDAIAYVTLALEMMRNGALYVASWGHIDLGLVLPPLYPLLIGVGSFFCDDHLRVAGWISGTALILAGIPFALLIRDVTGRVVAVFAALLIPFGPLFAHAFAPLTETLFLLLTALALLVLRRSVERGEVRSTFAAGLLCGLAFLTRPVGLILLAFALMWLAITATAARGERSRRVVRQLAAALAGFLVIVGPWAIGLFVQTGQHPLQRTFRMGTYSVSSDDPEVMEEIRQIRESDDEIYESIYRSRRRMRKLVPDASEMYLYLAPSSGNPDAHRTGLRKIWHEIATEPFGVFENLLGNAISLQRQSGIWLFALFVITSLTPLTIRRGGFPWRRRFMLSAWVWFYILAVSSITDLVSRYVIVVLPFALLHVALEVCALASMVTTLRAPWRRTAVCIASLLPAVNTYQIATASEKLEGAYSVDPALYAPLREFIQEGDVVFAPAPLDAYLLGAGYRILPDDSLNKVATYAKRTGVQWLVVAQKWHNGRQIRLYEHKWYTKIHHWRDRLWFSSPERTEIVKCCETDGGEIALYEFRNSSGNAESTRRRVDADADPGQDGPANGSDDGE